MDGGFIYYVSSAVCVGIALTLLWSLGVVWALFFIAAGLLVAFMGALLRNRLFFLIAVVLIAAALGVVRTDIFIVGERSETLQYHIGETSSVSGTVVNDPERRATSLHVNLKVEKVGDTDASGVLLVILPRDADISYGDTVEVDGAIAQPQPFDTNTGRTFDYAGYLRVQGVSAMMQKARVTNVEKGGFSVPKFLYNSKHVFEHSLERMLPEPDGSLMEGILLGERRGLPPELNQAFIVSGLVHVVVLSGYNISIVSEALLRATSFLPRVMNFGVGGVFMIFFALMTGAGSTTVRACTMGLIAIFARYLNRPADALRALCVAATAMALWNPLVLLHDPSFILSVLATFGLITLSTTVEKYVQFVPEKFGFRSIAASTISVQIFVLPALLYFMGILSFVALPANMIGLPVVPFAMLLGFLAGIFGLIHPALGLPFALLADALLKFMMLVANTAHDLPFSSAVVSAFPAWVMILIYIPLTFLAARIYWSVCEL